MGEGDAIHQERINPSGRLRTFTDRVHKIGELAEIDAVFFFPADAFRIHRHEGESIRHLHARKRANDADADFAYTIDNAEAYDPNNPQQGTPDIAVHAVMQHIFGSEIHLVRSGGFMHRVLPVDNVKQAIERGDVRKVSAENLKKRGYTLDAIASPAKQRALADEPQFTAPPKTLKQENT